jgi:uncharacterized protein (DUF952 family)
VRPTYHLTPAELWEDAAPDAPLTAPSLIDEGFIHCTDGAEAMVMTANRHYRADPRPFVILTIDLDRVGSPWRIDDPGRIYPHIHGPIDRASIVGVTRAPRAADGEFLPFA